MDTFTRLKEDNEMLSKANNMSRLRNADCLTALNLLIKKQIIKVIRGIPHIIINRI